MIYYLHGCIPTKALSSSHAQQYSAMDCYAVQCLLRDDLIIIWFEPTPISSRLEHESRLAKQSLVN